jgi:Integrase core domain
VRAGVERSGVDRSVGRLEGVEKRADLGGGGDSVTGAADGWERELEDGVAWRLAAPVGAAEDRAATSRASPTGPRTNGKVERFDRTMPREWAYGRAYPSHHDRTAALPDWLRHYNARRPHSSIGDRPPISRFGLGFAEADGDMLVDRLW